MPPRHFRHGPAFATLNTALGWILAENDVYYRHKFLSYKWMRNWSINQISVAVGNGWLFQAEDVTDYFKRREDGTF